MSKFALVFLLVYLGGLGATIFFDAVWGFYLYELVYFLYPENRWWGQHIPDISYSFTLVIIILILYVARYRSYSETRLLDIPQTKWLIFILIMFGLTYFFAVNPAYHKKALLEVTKLFIIIAIGYKLINTEKKLDWALYTYILGAAYIGLEAFRAGRDWQGRVEGIGTPTTDDANGVAAMLAPTLAIIMFYAWRGGKKTKAFVILFGVVIVNGLILINSRGAFLGVIIGCGYLILNMLMSSIQQANQKLTAVIIITASLFGGLYLTDDTFWERMSTLTEVQTNQRESGSHRVHIWMATFDVMADYPFGVGAAGFQMLSPYYVPEELFFMGQETKAVHSTWFQSLAELGWPGPILLCGLLISCFRLTKRSKTQLIYNNDSHHYFQLIALEGALITFIVSATFIDEFRSEIFYWLIMFTASAGNIFYVKPNRYTPINA